MVRALKSRRSPSLLAGRKHAKHAPRLRGKPAPQLPRECVRLLRGRDPRSSSCRWVGGRGDRACGKLRGSAAARGGVFPAELVHTTGGVDDLLLARVERMAVRAHLDLQIMSQGRARLERVAARAGDGNLSVLGVNRSFHGRLGLWVMTCPVYGAARALIKGRASVAAAPRRLKHRDGGGPGRAVPYPQKLWTTLWMARRAGTRFRSQIAFLLLWSKNDQAIFTCDLNNLQPSCAVA